MFIKLLDNDDQRLKRGCTCPLCDKKFEQNSWHMKRHMQTNHVIKGHLDAFNIIQQVSKSSANCVSQFSYFSDFRCCS